MRKEMTLRQQKKHVVPVVPPRLPSPTLVRETITKVDQCIARLHELQDTVKSRTKAASGVGLSCQCSPPAKLLTGSAMLLGKTVGEIVQASEFARNIVEAVSKTKKERAAVDVPKMPIMERRKLETSSSLQARRKREKQLVLQTVRSEQDSSSDLRRAKSNINFKMSTMQITDHDKENKCNYAANKVSPRTRPWGAKTVLFPNPLFEASPHKDRIETNKNKSPMIATKLRVNIKSPPRLSVFPMRGTRTIKRSSPKPVLSTTAEKLRRSLSPSRFASRLVAPLKRESYYRKMWHCEVR